MSIEFGSLNLNEKLVSYLRQAKYKSLSPVQEKTIPLLLKNKSVVVKAPTGSGKTLSYLVPILNNLSEDLAQTTGIIIVPTSVLANQLRDVLLPFIKGYQNFSLMVIAEGKEIKDIVRANIIIATPDQFLFNLSHLNLRFNKYLIIDEGDMILFGGFESQLNEILGLDIPGVKALFTASIDEHLNTLVRKYIGAETLVDVSEKSITSKNVKHCLVDIRHVDKAVAIENFIKAIKPYKTIVFASKTADLLLIDQKLSADGIKHLMVYGGMSKREQKQATRLFNDDKCDLMIATDIIARGIDIDNVTDIVSLDLPYDLSYYFHRAGRSGRFDKKGTSYVFYNNDDTSKAKELVKRGVEFTFYSLQGSRLVKERDLNQIKVKRKLNNVLLEEEIRKNISHLRTKKVKPCYKKKIRQEIARTKKRHKQRIIKSNIYKRNHKEGTEFTYISKLPKNKDR
ncbi:MAG: DEAD/DEAH box helicase [Bacilli bacterium]|nr:DEAD/DEAH box helicase [Bacilli bacterium]